MRNLACILAVTLLAACGDTSAPQPAAPPMPTGVLTSARTAEITVTWKDVANETAYRVDYRAEDGEWRLLRQTGANVTFVTHTGVEHNVTYFYRVSACNDIGCSAPAQASGKWQGVGPPALISLNVTSVGAVSATFITSVRSGGLPVRLVYTVSKAGQPTPVFVSEPQTATPLVLGDYEALTNNAFVYNALEAGTDYSVAVSAVNDAGSSPPIQSKSFRTTAAAAPTLTEQETIAAQNGAFTLRIRVLPNGVGTDYRFELIRAGDSFSTPLATQSGFVPAGTTAGILATFAVSTVLQPGLTYDWRVVAQNSLGTTISPTQRFTRP